MPVNTRKTRSDLAFLALLLLLLIFSFPPAGAAQGGAPCEVASPPGDGLQSAAFGLTRAELDALYGPGNAAQTGWIYQFDGFDLTLVDCDLILTLDPDGQFADPAAARDLVRTLLPEDAVLAGTWEFGTLRSVPQSGEEWVSAALAARYRLLGEPFTGSILALYTYSGDAYTPGPVAFVELRAAEIP
jgi:hypothetical protein